MYIYISTINLTFAQEQEVFLPDTIRAIFENIDVSQAETGFLKDQGYFLESPSNFVGTLHDSNFINMAQWEILLAGVYYAKANNSANWFPEPTAVMQSINGDRGNDTIPIVVNHTRMNHIIKVAIDSGWYTLVDNKLLDQVPEGKNPFAIEEVFAAMPIQTEVNKGKAEFVFQDNYIFSNAEGVLVDMSFDGGDGNGYQSVNKDIPFSYNYETLGVREWKVRFTYDVGGAQKTYESHGYLNVKSLDPNCASCRTAGSVYLKNVNYSDENGAGTIASEKYNLSSDYAKGYKKVFKSGSDFDKPLIVFAGFDKTDSTAQFRDFVNYYEALDDSQLGKLPLDLQDSLYNEGYDIVFVDYANSKDYIQNNAKMAKEVIHWVNSKKVETAEPNVVMGISMGGLVASYALREMEIEEAEDGKAPHDTRLLITMDTPHRGANVPLSVQALLLSLKHYLIFFDFAQKELALFNSPAAKQMMVESLDGFQGNLYKDNQRHYDFMQEYHETLGMPQNCRKVAVSNGSTAGLDEDWNGFAPGGDLLSVNSSCLLMEDVIQGSIKSPFWAEVFRLLSLDSPTDIGFKGDIALRTIPESMFGRRLCSEPIK